MSTNDVHILLLTGRPGSGKTTVLRRVAEQLRDWHVEGFYTEEIRENGTRQGFRAVTLDGDEAVIARADRAGKPRIGKYAVDVPAIDEIVESTLRTGAQAEAVLIDEIGKMECLSGSFLDAVTRLLDQPVPIVATVARQGRGLISAVKERSDARIVEVTSEHRDELPARIVAWLEARRPGRPS